MYASWRTRKRGPPWHFRPSSPTATRTLRAFQGSDEQRHGIAALVLGSVGCVFFSTVFGGIILDLLDLLGLVFGIVAARRARGQRAPHRVMAIVGALLRALVVLPGDVGQPGGLMQVRVTG
jgi:hypothetical protein